MFSMDLWKIIFLKEQIQALRSVLAENYQHPLEPLKQK